MTQDASFSIAFAADVDLADREALLLPLRANAPEVQETSSKSFDWQTFVVIMDNLGKVAGGTAALITLRKRGTTPTAQLVRSGQATLDLATASEQELLDWLLAGQPRP